MVQTNLPVIILRDIVILPNNELRIEISSEEEKSILEHAELSYNGHILFVNLANQLEEKPAIEDLPKIGIIGRIKTKIELPNGIIRTIIVGIDRGVISEYINNQQLEAIVIPTDTYEYEEFEASALKRILLRDLNNYIELSPMMSNSVLGRIDGVKNISLLTDIIALELPLKYQDKLKYVSSDNPINRIRMVIEDLNKEIETIKLENQIEKQLKQSIDSNQKEYLLKEKIKVIKEELGENDLKETEIEQLKEQIKCLDANQSVKNKLEKELSKYELTPSISPEITIIRSYIDWLLSIPWNKKTKDNENIEDIRKILDQNHHGLDEIKKRIIEYIAVQKHTKEKITPILCFVGPPGVGKTTLAKSIAKALNKKYTKISVGGVNDESEITGHRRTYIGANPGKIIQQLKKVGSNNPVFLIDEIDKMTKDYKGDPASALLDILDKEQNNMYQDNYLEETMDLSNVMFILTANNKELIPEALKDRLEIIELNSYTLYEKVDIFYEHLLHKLKEKYVLDNITFEEEAIIKIINNYTKEAGIRDLERKIEQIFRMVTLNNLSSKQETDIVITKDNVIEYLGIEKYLHQKNKKEVKSGIANALAYTSYGGTILKISITNFPGKGNLEITGNLGDVMKESVKIALSYIKSNHQLFDLDFKKFQDFDYHIHFEEGATPKDGPSAGITITTAIISLLKDFPIDNTISMTGEITLRGKILPIGGVKEKLIAAYSNNIKTIYLPIDNKRDVSIIDKNIINKLKIVYVERYEEIYQNIFK